MSRFPLNVWAMLVILLLMFIGGVSGTACYQVGMHLYHDHVNIDVLTAMVQQQQAAQASQQSKGEGK